jgi:homoserine kinase type II
MGTFRTLTDAQVREILHGFAIAGYRGHRALTAGTINTNFAVDTDSGRLFLRINEGKSRADVEREACIVAHVAARGLPTPAPTVARDGSAFVLWQGVHVSLFPWIEGRTLQRTQIGPGHAQQVGRALGRLHLAGADFSDHRPGRYEPDEIGRRFARIVAEAPGDAALAEATRILGPELGALAQARRPDLPLGLIHGDLFIDNVLFADDGTLTAVLDFEQASWGRLVYDLAVCVLAFGYGGDDFRPDVTRAFIDGYVSVHAPTADERAAFGAELRFACCRFAVTRITDIHLRRDAGVPGGKDFRRYLARLASVKAHAAAGDGLLTLP